MPRRQLLASQAKKLSFSASLHRYSQMNRPTVSLPLKLLEYATQVSNIIDKISTSAHDFWIREASTTTRPSSRWCFCARPRTSPAQESSADARDRSPAAEAADTGLTECCLLLSCGAQLVVAKLDQLSFHLGHLICAHSSSAWRRVGQVRVLRCGASCWSGLTGACRKYLRNERYGPHKCGRINPTSPPSRRAGWQRGPLSLKPDHCGPPNRYPRWSSKLCANN
jgi:hypothetical protein